MCGGGGRGCIPEIPSPHACLVPMNFQALNYKTSLSAFVSGKVNKFRYSSNHRRSKSVKAEFSRQKRNVEVKIKAKGKFRTKSCAVSEISSRFRSFKVEEPRFCVGFGIFKGPRKFKAFVHVKRKHLRWL